METIQTTVEVTKEQKAKLDSGVSTLIALPIISPTVFIQNGAIEFLAKGKGWKAKLEKGELIDGVFTITEIDNPVTAMDYCIQLGQDFFATTFEELSVKENQRLAELQTRNGIKQAYL